MNDKGSRRSISPTLATPVIVLILVGGRWGSYLGLPAHGIFIQDLLLITLTAVFLLNSLDGRRNSWPITGQPSFILALSVIFSASSLFFFGEGTWLLRLRDLAPWLYLLMFPLWVHALSLTTPQFILRVIHWSLLIHLVWVLPATLGLLDPISLFPTTFAGAAVFELRTDFDGPLLAVGVAMVLAERSYSTPLYGHSFLLWGGWAALLLQASRATLLALLAVAVTYIMLRLRRDAGFRVPPRTIIGILTFFAAGTLVLGLDPGLLPQGGALARVGLISSTDASGVASAEGSQRGRATAWALMLDYTNQSRERQIVGAGPGAEMVRDSTAVLFLSGDLRVRAPHNWLISLYGRYGAVGIVLWFATVVTFLRPSVRSPVTSRWSQKAVDDNALGTLRVIGGVLAAAMLSSALVGVIMESPFGIIAFTLGLSLFAMTRTAAKLLPT